MINDTNLNESLIKPVPKKVNLPISPHGVRKAAHRIKNNKTDGHDGISNEILKQAEIQFYKIYLDLINQ